MTRSRRRKTRERTPRWVPGLSPNCRNGRHGPTYCTWCPCTDPTCHSAPPVVIDPVRDHDQITALADAVRAQIRPSAKELARAG